MSSLQPLLEDRRSNIRAFNCPLSFPIPISRLQFIGYFSGFLFALGWFLFIDGVSYASTDISNTPVSIGVEDFVPENLINLGSIINIIINHR